MHHRVFTCIQVRVLGEGYTPDDEEDSAVAEVTAVHVYQVCVVLAVVVGAGVRGEGVCEG
jgi:hypothetical protein